MVGLIAPILIFQAYCVYHAYRNRASSGWYLAILLLPLIGCIFYLLNHLARKAQAVEIPDDVAYYQQRIIKLEDELRFSDTLANKERLADAYVEVGRYGDAIALYKSCLSGFMADDPGLRTKLLGTQYLNSNYEEVASLGEGLEKEKSFRDAPERIAYAWSLHHLGRIVEADAVFADMDRAFTNYDHRLEYSKFLKENGRDDKAKGVVDALLNELGQMKGPERHFYRDTIRDIKEFNSMLAQDVQ